MPFRLACDVDVTLADMNQALNREASRLFGPGARLSGPSAISGAQCDQLWAHVGTLDNFWMTLNEAEPGAVRRLAAISTEHRWEVIFLTQRPESAGQLAQVQTQRWLMAHGFELPSVFVVNGPRGSVAQALALDAVLDDSPDNCLDVVTHSRARAVLLRRDESQTIPPNLDRVGIEIATSTADALARLEQIADLASRPRGLVSRLRAAIGV